MVIIQCYISYWVMASTLALVCHYRPRNIHKCDTDTWQNGRGREVEDDIKLLLHRHGNLRTDLLSAHKTAFTHYTLPTVIWQIHTRALAHTHTHTHTTQHTDVRTCIQRVYKLSCAHLRTCHTSVRVIRNTCNAYTIGINTGSVRLAHWLILFTLITWLAYSDSGSHINVRHHQHLMVHACIRNACNYLHFTTATLL